jgi:hypothetical protein
MAATTVVPWVTEMETAARVVERGKERAGEFAGPRLEPKMENWAPCAIPPEERAGGDWSIPPFGHYICQWGRASGDF